MPLTFAAVMPHGGMLVPGVDPESPPSPSLEEAMKAIADRASSARLDTLIIATPHGICLEDVHTIALSERVAGDLGPHQIDVATDLEFGRLLLSHCLGKGIPVAGVVNGESNQPLPMDWGVFIPAWYIQQVTDLPPLVVVCPTRSLGFESIVSMGRGIAHIAESGERRIGLIASADQGHAHDPEGPYGFDPSAAIFDQLVVGMTERGDYGGYVNVSDALIEAALPDSLWQLALLTGAFQVVPFEATRVTYDCPTYFGMMATEFERVQKR